MKSLYESILDDEDVLISDTKEFANNPLNLLINTLERRNIQEIQSLIQDGVLDGFFKDVLNLNIKFFNVKVACLGSQLYVYFKFGYDYIITFSHSSRGDIHILLVTKKLFNEKYKNTVLENTTLYKNRRKIIQNLKKIGFEKAFYNDKNYEYYRL